MSHLDQDAAAPFTADELAQLGRDQGGDAEQGNCVMPAPQDAGGPKFKLQGREADRRFAYRDHKGEVLGYVLRWEKHKGADKEFRPFTYWRNGAGAGTWRAKAWPEPRPLFGLDLLAAHPDAIVLLTEGEKAAEAVEQGPLADAFIWAKQRVIGMTWPSGTKAIAQADFSPLAGRDVILLPDHDEPGEEAADALVKVLGQIGVKRLRRWCAPAQARKKWDIADAVPDGLAPEVVVKSLLEAPDIGLRIVKTLPEFLADFQPPDYLADGLLQKHFCYSVTGATGSGKTAVALLISTLVASHPTGRKMGPHEIEHGRVVYIAAENPTDIQMRLIGMAAKLKLDIKPGDFLAVEQIEALDKDMPRIEREIADFGDVDLVVVDTAPSLFQGDNENDNRQMRDHAKRLRKLCDLPGRPCVLALCHPTKHVSGPDSLLPRGGGAFLAEVDGNLTVWRHDDLCTLHWTGKFRGPDFDKINFRFSTVTTTALTDSKGRLLPTVMAQLVTEAEAAATEEAAIGQEDQLLIAMHRRPDGSLVQWATDCRWFVAGDPLKPSKGVAHRVIKRLEKDKLVAKQGRELVLTKTGTAAAKKAIKNQES